MCQHRRLVCDAVLHGQPVKRLQQRRGVVAASALTDNAGEVVLCPLELVDGRGRRTIKQSVAVIEPRGDDAAPLRRTADYARDEGRGCDSVVNAANQRRVRQTVPDLLLKR